MTFTKQIGLLWRVARTLPKLDELDVEFVKAEGDQVKEAEVAWKAGILDIHQLNRLRTLWRFCKLSSRAKEIESEWQKIQQNEHDEFFKFQVFRGSSKDELAYKKGITDGIKWCVERFS